MQATKNLLLAATAFCGGFASFAQTWTLTSAPNIFWNAIASSADGSKLIATASSWKYYISTNSGSTWTINTQPQAGSEYGSWLSIASSADGTKLAGINSTAIWVSTNSGATWFSNNVPGAVFFSSVALSADGNKLVVMDGWPNAAGSLPGLIYTSTNSGITVTPTTAPTNNWTSVASSADGTKLVAVAWPITLNVPCSMYLSTNSGATWMPANEPNSNWVAVASSADGNKLVAASAVGSGPLALASPGAVYTSTNAGATWVLTPLPNGDGWSGVASSADGNRLVAVGQGRVVGIYTSTNSGKTWLTNNVPNETWYGAASSADGSKLVAIVPGYGIYTLHSIPTPRLNLTPSPTNLTLGWTVPSTNFVLQQNSDLTTTNWSVVTNPPVLNLTNLQNQVTLPSPAGSGFYRLKTP
jgi:hypothetical protein